MIALPDAKEVAARLEISTEAVELLHASDYIDLHLDSFIWPRVFGYDLTKRHGPGPTRAWFMGQTDIPRLLESGMTGGMWSITTNPYWSAKRRSKTFFRNLERLLGVFESEKDRIAVVRSAKEYKDARAAGKHGAWVVVQGGNALDHDLADFDRIPKDLLTRVTVVHLSHSSLGGSSSPFTVGEGGGLTDYGRDYVRRLNEKRIFVDLAHISRQGFFDAVEVHDKSQPLIVTHTGVTGVYDHWRNLNDDQLRAVADTGGVIGVMYQSSFLGPSLVYASSEWIVDHLDHIIRVVGEDHAAIGSDWDGAIVAPADMRTCEEFPRVVQVMLDRGWSEERIRKVLGGNYLRTLEHLRPSL